MIWYIWFLIDTCDFWEFNYKKWQISSISLSRFFLMSWRKYRDFVFIIIVREEDNLSIIIQMKNINSRSLKNLKLRIVKQTTQMIRETLFKEKQIFPVFFQIPSAVYVWTQVWSSFQMERSHFDKMTSITTPHSKMKNALDEWQEIRRDKRVMEQGAHDLQCLRMSRSLISDKQGRIHVNHNVYHWNVSRGTSKW